MIVIETIRDIAIALALAILFPLTFDIGFRSFWPSPSLDFSEEVIRIDKERDRLSKQIDELEQEKKFDDVKALKKQLEDIESEYHAAAKPFFENYRKAHAQHEWAYGKLYLPLGVILGVLLIIIALFIPIMSIAAGFMLGGVACLVWVLWPWWWYIRQPQLKFFIVLGVVIALIALSYILFRRRRRAI